MYEAFYGMRERPFALTPDPAFLFLSAKHSSALSMLEYSLTGQAGFTVVTGEIGSGKTTLIREFLKRADRAANIGVISNTHVAFGDLLQWVLLAFGLPPEAGDKTARYQAFLRYLIERNRAGMRTVLIVDEAQNLSVDALEELRLLSNVNAGKDQVLQMILVGQPELLESLKRPELRQFAQRISVHYHLSPLTWAETRDYVRHRLRVAGTGPDLFDRDAIGAIAHFSGGIPRLINSICDMALVYGFAASKRAIGIDTVFAVVRDKERSSLLILPKSSDDTTREALIAETDKALGWDDPDPAEQFAQSLEAVATPGQGHRSDLTSEMPEPAMARRTDPQRRMQIHAGIGEPAPPGEGRVVAPIEPSYLERGNRRVGADARARRGRRRHWVFWLL